MSGRTAFWWGLAALGVLALATCRIEVRPALVIGTPSGVTTVPVAAGTPLLLATPQPTCAVVPPIAARDRGTHFQVLGEARCAGWVTLRIFGTSGQQTSVVQSPLVTLVGSQGTAPFEISYPNPPFTVTSYTVEVQPLTETVPPSSAMCQLKSPGSGQDRGTFYELTGDVTCSGTAEATFVRVAAIFLNRSGEPVGAGVDIFMQGRVAPGGRAPFRIVFRDAGVPPSSITAFRVFVDWK